MPFCFAAFVAPLPPDGDFDLLGGILGSPLLLVLLVAGKSTNKLPTEFGRVRWELPRVELLVCGFAHASLNLECNENGSDNLLSGRGNTVREFSVLTISSTAMASWLLLVHFSERIEIREGRSEVEPNDELLVVFTVSRE
ncbi:hypothetical protein MHU86_14717 [Fragilaria crotonensis]|nr:hypothetical protein MHU86_14717 [Fragilaria crotonensis]